MKNAHFLIRQGSLCITLMTISSGTKVKINSQLPVDKPLIDNIIHWEIHPMARNDFFE